MIDPIDSIYINSIKRFEKDMLEDKQYEKARNQTMQHYEILRQTLSEDELNRLDKLVKSYDIMLDRRSTHCFRASFKTGMAVIAESLV